MIIIDKLDGKIVFKKQGSLMVFSYRFSIEDTADNLVKKHTIFSTDDSAINISFLSGEASDLAGTYIYDNDEILSLLVLGSGDQNSLSSSNLTENLAKQNTLLSIDRHLLNLDKTQYSDVTTGKTLASTTVTTMFGTIYVKERLIENSGNQRVYLLFSSTEIPSSTNYSISLGQNEKAYIQYRGDIKIRTSAGSSLLMVTNTKDTFPVV